MAFFIIAHSTIDFHQRDSFHFFARFQQIADFRKHDIPLCRDCKRRFDKCGLAVFCHCLFTPFAAAVFLFPECRRRQGDVDVQI